MSYRRNTNKVRWFFTGSWTVVTLVAILGSLSAETLSGAEILWAVAGCLAVWTILVTATWAEW